MPEEALELRLKRLPVFEEVDDSVLVALEPEARERFYPASEVVYRTGGRADGLYAVLEGSVVVRTERRGEPVDRFLDVGPSDVFGESEVVSDAPREHTARTLEPSQLLWLPAEPLRAAVRRHAFLGTLLTTLSIRRKSQRTRIRVAPSTRREPRIWIDRDVELKIAGGRPATVRLADLSYRGVCLAWVPWPWTAGQHVRFTLGTAELPDLLPVSGVVCWQELGAVGVVFERDGLHLRQKVERALRVLVP
jgi:CRP-like cAMP-binding protein